MIYSIEVGRWTGAFSMMCYADVFSSEDERRLATFNAFTKRGAKDKAARYVRRMHRGGNVPNDVTIYTYDARTHELSELPGRTASANPLVPAGS